MTREHLNLQTADKRVVTPEMLRAYWFGWPQVPFWNYDPSKLQVGVEGTTTGSADGDIDFKDPLQHG
jgi:hypothetical protein